MADTIISLRLDDEEWKVLEIIKVITGIEKNSRAVKYAMKRGKNVLQRRSMGEFDPEYDRLPKKRREKLSKLIAELENM